MASEKLQELMESQDGDAKMDMSPMIDMVFLLLIFFMVASTLIVNRLDPNVQPPVADSAIPVDQAAGRIVINIYSEESKDERRKQEAGFDATFADEDGNALEDEDAIITYVDELKKKFEESGKGIKPKILLRGDHRAFVKEAKIVARAAGKAGVDQIIFSTYQVDPK